MKSDNDNNKPGNNFSGPFRHAFNKARLIFKPPDKDDKKEPGATNCRRDRLKELLDRVDAYKEHIDSVIQNEALQSSFHSYLRSIVTLSFSDGVNGCRNTTISEVARGKAIDMYYLYRSNLSDKEAQLEEEFQTKKQRSEDKEIRLTIHRDYQNYIQYHSKFNERGNTIGEAILYFICFLIVFVADIPLAADLLKRLFEESPGTGNVFSDIGQHLNAILTAIGVAASTIYIKVWYDEFVGKKYGHAFISKKKFEELFSSNPERNTLDDKEKSEIKKEHSSLKRTKLGLLIFTCMVIMELGFFKGYAWMQSNHLGLIPPILIPLTMILLTLLFSVIGGVCLSISLSALTTYRRLRKCHSEALKLEAEHLGASNDLAILKGKKAGLSTIIQKLEGGEDWKNNIIHTILFFYNTGFSEGATEPGYYIQHLDFFDRILMWRGNAIANNIQKSKNNE